MPLSIPIPDNVRPYLALLAKYHFWILAAIVPLVVFPVLAAGNGWLRNDIATKRNLIDGKLSQVSRVTGIVPHPNEKWSASIDGRTGDVAAETAAERYRFWHSQQSLRVWPAELGEDFLAAISTLAPGQKLDRPLLRRYQQIVPRLVKALPARMGSQSHMTDAAAAAGGDAQPVERDPSQALEWNAADQKTVYGSFVWQNPPSTAQVLLAQEELWIYGILCDAIAQFNRGATGSHDAAITLVQQLVIGYHAAQAGMTGTEQRIFVPAATGGGEGEAGVPTLQSIAEPPPADPGNPRYGGGPAGGGDAKDEDFRNWVYVDFSGRPLLATDLATKPGMNLVHLSPFILNLVIDQRRLDAFLALLDTWPIPIEIREVRINVGGRDTGAAMAAAPADATNPARRHDIRIELRGTIALAPNPAQSGAPAAPAPGDGGHVPRSRILAAMPGRRTALESRS